MMHKTRADQEAQKFSPFMFTRSNMFLPSNASSWAAALFTSSGQEKDHTDEQFSSPTQHRKNMAELYH